MGFIPGLYFLCLSSAQKVMAEHWPRGSDGKQVMPNLKTFSLGAMSRATAAFVFCPITVVKTRMVGRAAWCLGSLLDELY